MPLSSHLPIDAFPGWAHLNDVRFRKVTLQDVGSGRGYGLIAETDLQGDDARSNGDEAAALLSIPTDLVLSAQAVDDYAKVDQNFRQLLDAAGKQSTRGDVMLYLIAHVAQLKRGRPLQSRGLSPTPWSEYIRFLPEHIPVPTMWTDPERLLLNGTSLEAALEAKLAALTNEFDQLRENSSNIPFWNELFSWETEEAILLNDWVLADAWYRSRCLELPSSGHAMVPGLDMINHAASATAYYEESSKDSVELLIRPGCKVTAENELTISYGDEKSPSEMLFSYGFIDLENITYKLTLYLDPLPDDPLAKAKFHVFGGPPTLTVCRTENGIQWSSPIVYLICLNEEDGLDFRLLQDNAGERQLRVFWQDHDVTGRAAEFETLIQDHPLCEVIKLRAATVIHERVESQLARLSGGLSGDQLEPLVEARVLKTECIAAAAALKDAETVLLTEALASIEQERANLLAHEHVVAYLGSMEDSQIEQGPEPVPTNEDADDFS